MITHRKSLLLQELMALYPVARTSSLGQEVCIVRGSLPLQDPLQQAVVMDLDSLRIGIQVFATNSPSRDSALWSSANFRTFFHSVESL